MTLLALPGTAGRPLTDPPALAACDRCGARTALTQTCAPCGEALCSDCYRPWTALACGRCRTSSAHLAVPPAA